MTDNEDPEQSKESKKGSKLGKGKAGLLFVAVTLISMASHSVASGEFHAGLVQMLIGMAMIGLYEVVQTYQINLSEEEIETLRELALEKAEEWKHSR